MNFFSGLTDPRDETAPWDPQSASALSRIITVRLAIAAPRMRCAALLLLASASDALQSVPRAIASARPPSDPAPRLAPRRDVRGLRGRILAFWTDAVPLAKELSHRAIGPRYTRRGCRAPSSTFHGRSA